MADAPKFSVVAGPPGAGKSTVLDALRQESGFPLRAVIEHADAPDVAIAALKQAIALRESVVVETTMQGPEMAALMQLAAERGFDVELVIVGIETPEILAERAKRRTIEARAMEVMFETTLHHLPAAVDQAKRIIVIDNTVGPTSVALQLAAAAQLEANDKAPSWVVNRILQPKAQRELSKALLRRASSRVAADNGSSPLLQHAKAYAGGTHTGVIVESTSHHVLQQISDSLHLVHDVAMMSPAGGLGLAKDAVVSISYQLGKSPSMLREAARAIDKSASR